MASLYGIAQHRPTPLENPILKTDMNANFKKVTNVNSVVFYKNGTNLTITLDTFLTLFQGTSKKLIDVNNSNSYVFVSNSIPYFMQNSVLKRLTIDASTPYIRQYEPQAYLTNLVVYQELLIEYPSSIDDSDYSVTYPVLTNGAITAFRIGNYVITDNSGNLISSNILTHAVKQLAP